MTAVIIPLSTWHVGLQYYYLRHPDVAPYIDVAFVERTIVWQALVWLAAWVAIAAAALLLRRRHGNSRLFGIVSMTLFSIVAPLESYAMGHYTTNYLAATGMTGRSSRSSSSIGATSTSAWAVHRGSDRHGRPAEQAGLIHTLRSCGPRRSSTGTCILLAQRTRTAHGRDPAGRDLRRVLHRDAVRAREERLTTISDELARANDVISQYIAVQVVEQIRAGNVDAVSRHDRRKLTLVFSDIKDFSEIADEVEPEELSTLLNEYLAEMTAIADAYEATLDKFMGDAILTFFGAPTATHDRDHALRAVRMAQEMQQRVGELRARWLRDGIQRAFEVRIGINTGVASVGTFGARGRMDYTAIGRQVNLAARLQVACVPGRILVSQATWSLVCDTVHCVERRRST